MTEIKDFFFNNFVPLCDRPEPDVDISTLTEFSKNCSPVVLEYGDKSKSVKELAAAILVNFCKSFSETKTFPKMGMNELTSLISKPMDCDCIAQQTLAVHITKTKLRVDESALLLMEINKMRVKIVESETEQKWKELVNKVIQHKQINEIILESIKEYGLLPQTSAYDDEKILISFVENVTTILRGFSGFHEIFINADHFHNKIQSFKGDINLLQLVAKMDIISIALHEYAHIKIRQCTGNFNMNTPILAQIKGLARSEHSEFGVYNEYRVFDKQVDWFRSNESNMLLDINYIERFIEGIEKGTQLPTGFIRGVYGRIQSPGMGVDMQLASYFC